MKAITASAKDGAALTPGALKAQIIQIRQGFDRPLPSQKAPPDRRRPARESYI